MKILQAVVAAALSLAAALPSQGVPVLQEAPSYRMSLSGPGLVAAGAGRAADLLEVVSFTRSIILSRVSSCFVCSVH